jgi:hypothetical protein
MMIYRHSKAFIMTNPDDLILRTEALEIIDADTSLGKSDIEWLKRGINSIPAARKGEAVAINAEYLKTAITDFRDVVLNQRGALAENGMTNDQVNDVLSEFDYYFDDIKFSIPPSAPQQEIPAGWISVNDSLPDFDVQVLLYEKEYFNIKNLVTGYRENLHKTINGVAEGNWCWITSPLKFANHPTHWMPIMLSAAPTAPIDNGVDVNWLIEEVTAIDTRYRGDPSYDHDAYYFKQKVLDLLNKLIPSTQS